MSTKKILIIAIVALVVIVAGIGGTFLFLNMQNSSNTETKEVSKEALYFSVGDMYSNMKESKRIIKSNITIEYTDKELEKQFTDKLFVIKDEINKIIREKTEDEVDGGESQEKLQEEIVSELGKIFETDQITNVYFEQFIVQ